MWRGNMMPGTMFFVVNFWVYRPLVSGEGFSTGVEVIVFRRVP